jgi:hypothetical protein
MDNTLLELLLRLGVPREAIGRMFDCSSTIIRRRARDLGYPVRSCHGRCGSDNPFYGKTHTERTRREISIKVNVPNGSTPAVETGVQRLDAAER